jgi:hypothetical protein
MVSRRLRVDPSQTSTAIGKHAMGKATAKSTVTSKKKAETSSSGFYRDLVVILGVAWAARLAFVVLVAQGAHSADVGHWMGVARSLDADVNPYRSTTYLNWPPLWMQVIYLIQHSAVLFGVSFLAALRLTLAAIESVMMVALLKLTREALPEANARRLILVGCSLNPIAILLVCQHGNFDVLVALFVVLFLLSLVRFHRDSDSVDWLFACLYLGLGVLAKTMPLVLAPLLLVGIRQVPVKARWLGVTFLVGPVALGMSIIYVMAHDDVTAKVLAYRSDAGWFGLSGLAVMSGAAWLQSTFKIAFEVLLAAVLIGGAIVCVKRKGIASRELLFVATLLLVAIPTLGPGYAPQYAFWYMPLLAITCTAYTRSWSYLVAAVAVVAVATYLVEYALFPSHGMFLLHLTDGAEPFATWGRTWSTQTAQTLFRLPLFFSLFLLLIVGARLLRKRLA